MNWRPHYPFEHHEHRLPDGQRMHFVDEGSGPTILCSHGNPTWSFYYRNVILGLRDQNRVLAIDHIGCGLSDKPRQYDYCLRTHTENLISFVESQKLSQVTILGHDWGGAIGLNAVRLAPKHFGRIVMLNTGAFPPPRIPKRIAVCRTPWIGPLAVRGGNAFARAAQRMALFRPNAMTPAELAGMIAPYDSWGNRIAIQRFVDDIPFTRRHPTYGELKALEQALPAMASMPIRLIWGMQDWCFDDRCLLRMRAAWPDAGVVKLKDAGHWVLEDCPNEVVDATRRFLESTTPAPIG